LFIVLQGAGWSNALLVIGPCSLDNRNQAQDAPFEETSHGRRASRLDRAIIIGGVAGWLAEQFMKREMGILMNIVLGVIGAAIASAILSFFGVHLGGWIGYLIPGFIGAVLLIWIVRAVQGTRRPV